MQYKMDSPEEEEMVNYKIVTSIDEAIPYILNEIKNKIIRSGNRFFLKKKKNLYEEDTSKRNKQTKQYLVYEIYSNINIYMENSSVSQIYSKYHKNATNLAKLSFGKIKETEFTNRLWDQSLYKLCFRNGYYDFREKRFKRYDNHTYSAIYIKRDFPKRDDDKIKKLYENILDPIFNDKEKQKKFLYWCSKGIAGSYSLKLWGEIIGLNTSSINILFNLFVGAFEDYILLSDISDMLLPNIMGQNRWLIPFEFRRLYIACDTQKLIGKQEDNINNSKSEQILNADIINAITIKRNKMMSQVLGNVKNIQCQGKLIFFTDKKINISKNNYNNMPMIMRLQNDSDNIEINMDNDIKDAFIHIILDHYANY